MTKKRPQSPTQESSPSTKRAKVSDHESSDDNDSDILRNIGSKRMNLRLTFPETSMLLEGLSALDKGAIAAVTDNHKRERYEKVENVVEQLRAKLADACNTFRYLYHAEDGHATSESQTAKLKEPPSEKIVAEAKRKEREPEWYIEDEKTKYLPVYTSNVFAPIPPYRRRDNDSANTTEDTHHDTSIAPSLPPLPAIKDPLLATATFQHPGSISAAKTSTTTPQTYERLEFLGDAYIEIISTRLIYARFPHRTAGQQAQIRELLVKNERLAEFARRYGFDEQVSVLRDGTANVNCNSSSSSNNNNNKHKKRSINTNVTNGTPYTHNHNHNHNHNHYSNRNQSTQPQAQGFTPKHWTKVLADVFEAYTAALILSDPRTGFPTAESWLAQLWEDQLRAVESEISAAAATTTTNTTQTNHHHHHHHHHSLPLPIPSPSYPHPPPPSSGSLVNLDTKSQLARKLLSRASRLVYRETKPMLLNRSTGRQVYSMGVFFSGHEGRYADYLLGKGQGQSKSQAGMSAAADALKGNMDVFEWVDRARREGARRWRDGQEKEKEKEKGKKNGGGVESASGIDINSLATATATTATASSTINIENK